MITLILGGARSGKSTVAEKLAGSLPSPVTYLATIAVGDDADLADRVARHRQRRPDDWTTVECGSDLADTLRITAGTVLLDSLGPWVAAHGGDAGDPAGAALGAALCAALDERPGDSVVVSEEVGLGVHPSTESGRYFRDALGTLNQSVAAVADRVLLVVAGRVLRLDDFDRLDDEPS